jgi:chemotaxis protein methyltransferase WspC
VTTSPVDPLVRSRLGIDPGSLGADVFPTAIEHRMTARHVGTPEAYVGLLSAEPEEWTALAAELVVPETWFFRGGRLLFDHLAGWVAERARSRGTAVRVLSLPCSTGEEPFSLSIALAEAGVTPRMYRLDGIDIAPAHLARAAAGRYSTFSFRETGPDPRPRHFRLTDDGRWELCPGLREAVRFRPGNAIDPALLAGEAPYDLILCRHLFIYLTPEARDRVMANHDRLLAADGLLGLSPAEVSRLPADRFAPDGPPGLCLFGRVRASRAVMPPPARRPAALSLDGAPPPVMDLPPVFAVPPAADSLALARALADAGRLDDALTACERAARGRVSADGFSLQGIIELARGRSEAAAAAFRKALYLDPDHPEALSHMIVLCEHRGESARAEVLRRRLARVEREESA